MVKELLSKFNDLINTVLSTKKNKPSLKTPELSCFQAPSVINFKTEQSDFDVDFFIPV